MPALLAFNFISIINVNSILANKITIRFLLRNFPTCGLPDISTGYNIFSQVALPAVTYATKLSRPGDGHFCWFMLTRTDSLTFFHGPIYFQVYCTFIR